MQELADQADSESDDSEDDWKKEGHDMTSRIQGKWSMKNIFRTKNNYSVRNPLKRFNCLKDIENSNWPKS